MGRACSTTRRASSCRPAVAGTAAAPSAARPTCRAAAPTAATAAVAATSCWCATTRCATCRASGAGPTSRPAAAATGRARCATAPTGTTSSCRVPPGTAGRRLGRHRATTSSCPGGRVVLARGGSGGRGNKRFATATRQAPRFAERGLAGEEGWVELQLKLLADVGLVGAAQRGQVVVAVAADARRAEGGRLPVHHARAGARHAGVRRPPARARRHPGPDRGRQRGRRPRPRLPRPRRAHAAARARARPRAARRLRPGRPTTRRSSTSSPRTIRGWRRCRGCSRCRRPTSWRPTVAAAAAAAWRERLGEDVAVHRRHSSATGAGLDELAHELLRRVPVEAPQPAAALAAEEDLAEHRVFRPAADRGLRVETRRGAAPSASAAPPSSACSPATTSTTRRRSPTSSSACTAWASCARSRRRASSPATTSRSAASCSSWTLDSLRRPMARYVVKLGSSVVAEDSGALRAGRARRASATQVAARHAAGDDVVVVTSGAIARGIQRHGPRRRARRAIDGPPGRERRRPGQALPRLRRAAARARRDAAPRSC